SIALRLEGLDAKRIATHPRRPRGVSVNFQLGGIPSGPRLDAATVDSRFVERVRDPAVPALACFDLDDGVFRRKNDRRIENHVPDDVRSPVESFALNAHGHFDVERSWQHDHVLKTMIR